jgi:sugar (pentulose or hexulose) kinase
MILWHDQRGAPLLDRLGPAERARVYEVTGLPMNGNYGLSKVAWAIGRLDGGIGDARWLNVSEYTAARMTGRRWAEYSLASRTMALDLRTRRWSDEVCELMGVDPVVFPELRSAADGSPVSAAFAAETGLSASVEVHVVGHDHMVGGVGAGLRHGEILNSTGTTEGVLLRRDEPALDELTAAAQLANGAACDGSDYTLFASIPTGGAAFSALQRMLGMPAETLSQCIAHLDRRYLAGEVDLRVMPVVIPQFRGSPSPEKSSSARGMFANLSVDTRAEDIVFGCFLGMALQFQKVLALFPREPAEVKLIGPASANPLWLSLKADVLGRSLSVSAHPEVVSRGAQLLACGEQGTWEDCRPAAVDADAGRHERLQEWHDGVQPELRRLAALSW